MSNEWKDLNTLQDVAKAQADGWEIEHCMPNGWLKWDGKYWGYVTLYRGRPAKPKMKTVTSECWRNKLDGMLTWGQWDHPKNWQRFPAGDFVGEVSE